MGIRFSSGAHFVIELKILARIASFLRVEAASISK